MSNNRTVFLQAPKKGDQQAYGARMAKKYNLKDDGGARGCWCAMIAPTAALAREAVKAMKADGLNAWDWKENVLSARQTYWEQLLRNKGYEAAVEQMTRFMKSAGYSAGFKIPDAEVK
ncbi:hypothetical protein FDI24_gp021 [Acidovorax phage ACP17]|uniref:Uncharacterized protein n=1 Tax=Acidovorax phage ACP17 TaxID=2010329 RepID=A0A218M3D9_9CAUD|nr:hypothetical protein FDI24_gp021 [Acidovorax phage ACP17]ASD50555.1 hypothetical protein [Acidovorax phage ACP17]